MCESSKERGLIECGEEVDGILQIVLSDECLAFAEQWTIADEVEVEIEGLISVKVGVAHDCECLEGVEEAFLFDEASALDESFSVAKWRSFHVGDAYAQSPSEDFFARRTEFDEQSVQFVACRQKSVNAFEHPMADSPVAPKLRLKAAFCQEKGDVVAVVSGDER